MSRQLGPRPAPVRPANGVANRIPSYARPTLSSSKGASQPQSRDSNNKALCVTKSKNPPAIQARAHAPKEDQVPDRKIGPPATKKAKVGKRRFPLGKLFVDPAHEDILKVILEMVDRKDLNACLRLSRQTNKTFLEHSTLQIRLRRLLGSGSSSNTSDSALRPRAVLNRLIHEQCRREQSTPRFVLGATRPLQHIDSQSGFNLLRSYPTQGRFSFWSIENHDGSRAAIFPGNRANTYAMCVADKVVIHATSLSNGIGSASLDPLLMDLKPRSAMSLLDMRHHPRAQADVIECHLGAFTSLCDLKIDISPGGRVVLLGAEVFCKDDPVRTGAQFVIVWNWMTGHCLSVRKFSRPGVHITSCRFISTRRILCCTICLEEKPSSTRDCAPDFDVREYTPGFDVLETPDLIRKDTGVLRIDTDGLRHLITNIAIVRELQHLGRFLLPRLMMTIQPHQSSQQSRWKGLFEVEVPRNGNGDRVITFILKPESLTTYCHGVIDLGRLLDKLQRSPVKKTRPEIRASGGPMGTEIRWDSWRRLVRLRYSADGERPIPFGTQTAELVPGGVGPLQHMIFAEYNWRLFKLPSNHIRYPLGRAIEEGRAVTYNWITLPEDEYDQPDQPIFMHHKPGKLEVKYRCVTFTRDTTSAQLSRLRVLQWDLQCMVLHGVTVVADGDAEIRVIVALTDSACRCGDAPKEPQGLAKLVEERKAQWKKDSFSL